jgi:hypothetical protein
MMLIIAYDINGVILVVVPFKVEVNAFTLYLTLIRKTCVVQMPVSDNGKIRTTPTRKCM